jgi:uncharacterized membrane-anchored protein
MQGTVVVERRDARLDRLCHENRIAVIPKQRLSATVDADVMQAAEAAVREGRAANVSAWVNEAMRRHMEHDRRMQALDEFIVAYEAEHGANTNDDIRGATRRARERAVVVRGAGRTRVKPTKRAAGA